MGCLIKTVEKKINCFKKKQEKEITDNKTNEQNKDIIDNDVNEIVEENQNKINNEIDINININKNMNQIKRNKTNSKIKNKDNYFKPEQLDYYSNVYLLKYIHIEPTDKINFKK